MPFERFSPKLQELLKKRGFSEPTLPQKMGIPEILSGRNAMIIAPTGSGKTETCMLPLFDLVHRNQHKPISILYINPLRALSRDLLDRLVWWADQLDLEISVRHGDVSQKERAIQREMPPHALITTPETLGAILVGKRMREHLRNVKYVVVDEIHELVESKRGIQLAVLLERLRELAGNFQRIGLSATIGSPELVAQFLGNDVSIIRAELDKKYSVHVETPKPTALDRAAADDLFISAETAARLRRLRDLLKSHQSVLAFTNTRETAEVLSSRLRSLDRELKQAVHHGSLSKEKRIKSEKEFKAQTLRSLIATSSLELGIDIGSIDLVIQYLSPRRVTRLIQRIGRSGHRIGETSKGIVITGGEDAFEASVVGMRTVKRLLEPIRIHEKAYDVLAQQLLGIALDEYGVPPQKMHAIVSRSYPFRTLTYDEMLRVLRFLESLRFLWLNEETGTLAVRRSRKAITHYFDHLSTIPDTRQYRIVSIIENEPIGFLDEEFVAEHGMTGEKFVCSGRAWKIIQVDEGTVTVEPVEDIESAIPAWEGELIPVAFDVAQDVGRLRAFIAENLKSGQLAEKLMRQYGIDANTAKDLIETISRHAETNQVPDHETLVLEQHEDFVIIHSCFGSQVNETLSKYLAAVITEETGVAVNAKMDPYRIILQTVYPMEKVADLLKNMESLQPVIIAAVSRSTLFRYRFMNIAKKMGILSRKVSYEKINMSRIIAAYENSPACDETLREIMVGKLDIEHAERIAALLREGKIKVVLGKGLSHLGSLGLEKQFSEIMKPAMPRVEIFRAFRRRLMATRLRLVCTTCGDYSVALAVRDIGEQPECPKCSSRLIASVHRNRVHAGDLVKKRLKKKPLTQEEEKELMTMRRSADLVVVYGKKAVIALAGHGVGPETAARILARLHPTKEKMLEDVLEAEKLFAKTKKYWKA